MFKGQQNVVNTVVKLLIRKGVVTDLARVPHNLDLSSPYMAATINSTLKPLETLSRAVNAPAQPSAAATGKSKINGESGVPVVSDDQGGTTHAAVNNAGLFPGYIMHV